MAYHKFRQQSMREKLKGKFKLMINKQLDRHTKIEKYANEPISFYLHKNRNFLRKLDNQEREDKFEEDELKQ